MFAYARLVEAAAKRERTLLTLEWRGVKPYYEFRRESGHDFTRVGAVAMRGTITCYAASSVLHRPVESTTGCSRSILGFKCPLGSIRDVDLGREPQLN